MQNTLSLAICPTMRPPSFRASFSPVNILVDELCGLQIEVSQKVLPIPRVHYIILYLPDNHMHSFTQFRGALFGTALLFHI